jgi:hypothetical protein
MKTPNPSLHWTLRDETTQRHNQFLAELGLPLLP